VRLYGFSGSDWAGQRTSTDPRVGCGRRFIQGIYHTLEYIPWNMIYIPADPQARRLTFKIFQRPVLLKRSLLPCITQRRTCCSEHQKCSESKSLNVFILAHSINVNCFIDESVVLVPNFHFINRDGFKPLPRILREREIPFDERKSDVFWRGSTTGMLSRCDDT